MPDLGWDIAETQLVHEKQENNDPHKTDSTFYYGFSLLLPDCHLGGCLMGMLEEVVVMWYS